LQYALIEMGQASMKYKLGKRKRVPLDTLSFTHYHQYVRKTLFISAVPQDNEGWSQEYIANSNYTLNENDATESLESFIQYLFNAIIYRNATSEELSLFTTHMMKDARKTDKIQIFGDSFNLFYQNSDLPSQEEEREIARRNIALIVMDYISRLSETYTFRKVK